MSDPKPSGDEASDNALGSNYKLQNDLKAIIAENEKPDISISRATLKDAELFDRELPYGPPNFHTSKYQEMLDGKGIMLLAKEGEKPVGQVVLELGGPRSPRMSPEVSQAFANIPEITAAEVVEEFRGRGIGGKMIQTLEAEAKALGFDKVCIGVATKNVDARRLYERLGYRDYGKPRHKVVSEDSEDQVVYLEKTL